MSFDRQFLCRFTQGASYRMRVYRSRHKTRQKVQKADVEKLFQGWSSPPLKLTEVRHFLTFTAGKEVYALRAGSVETVFGILRNVMKFNKFRLRGLPRVNAEWTLICLAWNLKRMHALCKSIVPR